MWKPDLHPRDEYGRFRLSGQSGVWDRLAGSVENQAHARTIAEHERLWERQFSHYQPLQAAGKLTPEMDAQWDRDIERRDALSRALPTAAHRHMVPHVDGTWRYPRTDEYRGRWDWVFDSEGRQIPRSALAGYTRVGNEPDARTHPERYHGPGGPHPAEGGLWHDGGYYPGGVPKLVNDWGHSFSERRTREILGLSTEPPKSRYHRDHRGAFVRGEMKAEARLSGAGETEKEVRRKGREVRTASPEVHGAYQNDPRNPVGRMRTAPGHRRRRQRTTWIQRLNAQMEGR